MVIRLSGEDVIITDQLQTYVEYRFFVSVARFQAVIRGVNVTLGHNPLNRGRFLCVVAVDFAVWRPDQDPRLRRPPECRNRPRRGSDVVTPQPSHLSAPFILNSIFRFETLGRASSGAWPSRQTARDAESVAVPVPVMASYRSLLMRSRMLLNLMVLGAVVAMPHRVRAQSIDQVATMPPNVVLGNYDSVPVGPFGGLEAGAYVARVSDPSAAWFNPAGLSREPAAQISASAGVYKWIAVSPEHLPHSGGSAQNIPNFVGGTFHLRGALNGGAVFLTTNSWLQDINSELFTPVQNGQERLGYSADSLFVRRVAAVGAGLPIGTAWRVGAGLSVSMTDLRLVQGISDRLADSSGVRTLLVTARTTGAAADVRAQGGVQYRYAGPSLRCGGQDSWTPTAS